MKPNFVETVAGFILAVILGGAMAAVIVITEAKDDVTQATTHQNTSMNSLTDEERFKQAIAHAEVRK